jgi:hypothetical protein
LVRLLGLDRGIGVFDALVPMAPRLVFRADHGERNPPAVDCGYQRKRENDGGFHLLHRLGNGDGCADAVSAIALRAAFGSDGVPFTP